MTDEADLEVALEQPQELATTSLDRVPFATLSVSVAGAIGLGLLVVGTNAAVGIAAGVIVDPAWAEWVRAIFYFSVITAAYVAQLGAVWALARWRREGFARAVGLRTFPLVPGIAMAVVVSVAGRLLAGFAALLVRALGVNLPEPPVDPTAILGTGPVSVVLVLVLVMVVAPFAEEVVFRGVLMGSLQQRYGPARAVVGSGLLFAMAHVQLATVFAIVFVGLAFGWVAMRYRSIWPAIVAHSLFNGVSVGAIFWLRSIGRL